MTDSRQAGWPVTRGHCKSTSQRRNNLRLSCPHCGGFARIRTSQQLTPTYREASVDCQDAECGWRGKLALEMMQTLCPSQRPNPEVCLPLAPSVRDALVTQVRPESQPAAKREV